MGAYIMFAFVIVVANGAGFYYMYHDKDNAKSSR